MNIIKTYIGSKHSPPPPPFRFLYLLVIYFDIPNLPFLLDFPFLCFTLMYLTIPNLFLGTICLLWVILLLILIPQRIREKSTKSRRWGLRILACLALPHFPHFPLLLGEEREQRRRLLSQCKTYGFAIILIHLLNIRTFNIRVNYDFQYQHLAKPLIISPLNC